MGYILEHLLNKNKLLYIELSKIFGVGYSRGKIICGRLGLKENIYVKELTEELLFKVERLVKNNYMVDSMLKRKLRDIVQKQLELKSYKGYRRLHGLPVNGQRTHTNRKTARKLNKVMFLK